MPTYLFFRLSALRAQLLPVVLSLLALIAAPATLAAPGAAVPAGTAADAPQLRLDDLTLLAVGAADRRAVIKRQNSPAVTLTVGQTVPGTAAVLTEVQGDRVLLIAPDPSGNGLQRIWMFRSVGGAPARIERFRTHIDSVAVKEAPSIVVKPLSGNAAASSFAPRTK